MVVTATAACSSGDAEPEAVAATPTPTSTIASGSSGGNVPPPVTRSPESNVVFRWVSVVDELSRSRVALPEGAKPIANTIPRPDGTTVTTRGFVFEHADGVLGFELIDDFATMDDLDKLAEFLAASVDGAVRTTEEADTGRERGIDGEISYGDNQVMLFRILVQDSNGDVWSGFVGGPESDLRRLESEFSRLTGSVVLRGWADPEAPPADPVEPASWVAVVDEPSGISADLPGAVVMEDRSVEGMPQRGYFHVSGVGFLVVDYPSDDYPLDAVLYDMATSLGDVVDSVEPAEGAGDEALDGVLTDGEGWVWAYRAIALDDRILLLHAVDTAEKLTDSQASVQRMSDSLTVP